MSIVPACALSRSDLRSLGNNMVPAVRHDQEYLEAVNRSLQVHNEQVQRLYRRVAASHGERLRHRAMA